VAAAALAAARAAAAPLPAGSGMAMPGPWRWAPLMVFAAIQTEDALERSASTTAMRERRSARLGEDQLRTRASNSRKARRSWSTGSCSIVRSPYLPNLRSNRARWR
jgi:hypothetical protein